MATLAQTFTKMNNKLNFAKAGTSTAHPEDSNLKVVEIYWNDIYKRVITEGYLTVYIEDEGGPAEKVLYINSEFDLSEDDSVSQRDYDAIIAALETQHPATYQKFAVGYFGKYARITAHVLTPGKFIVRNYLAFRDGVNWVIKED